MESAASRLKSVVTKTAYQSNLRPTARGVVTDKVHVGHTDAVDQMQVDTSQRQRRTTQGNVNTESRRDQGCGKLRQGVVKAV